MTIPNSPCLSIFPATILESRNSMRRVEILGNSPKIDSSAYVAETAVLIGDIEVGSRSSIWENAVLRADWNKIRVGTHTSIQDNVTLHVTPFSPTLIGNYVTVGHNAMIHGAQIGSNVIVGIGSVVLDGAVVEDNSMVAAGAVVPPKMEVPSGHLAAGVPAKLREFKGDPNRLRMNAEGYVALAEEYLKLKKPLTNCP
jgi:carbonic anhydrase/acetyltransferase-like protein (isoleucine patch superfamily)